MSEVHRYSVVKMLSEAGNKISYDPHGPEVVMAKDYDALSAKLAVVEDAASKGDAARRAAGQLRDRVCAEHRPKMTALMRMQDDVAALQVALNIVQRATDALGILAGKPFPARPSPSESPPDQGHMPAKAGPVTGEPVHPT